MLRTCVLINLSLVLLVVTSIHCKRGKLRTNRHNKPAAPILRYAPIATTNQPRLFYATHQAVGKGKNKTKQTGAQRAAETIPRGDGGGMRVTVSPGERMGGYSLLAAASSLVACTAAGLLRAAALPPPPSAADASIRAGRGGAGRGVGRSVRAPAAARTDGSASRRRRARGDGSLGEPDGQEERRAAQGPGRRPALWLWPSGPYSPTKTKPVRPKNRAKYGPKR